MEHISNNWPWFRTRGVRKFAHSCSLVGVFSKKCIEQNNNGEYKDSILLHDKEPGEEKGWHDAKVESVSVEARESGLYSIRLAFPEAVLVVMFCETSCKPGLGYHLNSIKASRQPPPTL